MINAEKNSFHEEIKQKMLDATRPGATNGRATRAKAFTGPKENSAK